MRTVSSQKGMTLLEVLVAISILAAVLGVIYTTFLSASKASDLIEADEEAYQTARSLIGMLSQELSALYLDPIAASGSTTTPQKSLKGLHEEADGERTDQITFITTSYRRKGNNSREGMIALIGYFFDVDAISGKKRLIRSEDPYLYDEEGGSLSPLTDRVESLTISYQKKDKNSDEWLDEWDTSTQKKLPDLIRIELSVLNDKDQAIPFRTIIRTNVGQ
jgi:type II secretion system protein J